jgi:hypothetical protein
MLLGTTTSLISFISGSLAFPLAWVSTILSSYVFKIVEFFSTIPFATIHVPALSATLLVLIYSAGVVVFMKTEKDRNGRRASV